MVDLSNMDDATREQARVDLMGIDRADLPVLRRVVAEMRQLQPNQNAVLRDVVEHVYLAGDPYDSDGFGFLGVVQSPDDPQPDDDGYSPVIVVGRVPGFAAYRMLQDGDVITAVNDHFPRKIHNNADLRANIGLRHAGEVVHLSVLRQGRNIDVPIKLSGRPIELNLVQAATRLEQLKNIRQDKADKYWEDNFEALLDPLISSVRGE